MLANSFWDLDSWAKIFSIIAVLIPALLALYKYIKRKKKKIIVSNVKPNIAYFTDRIAISKEIFEELQRSNEGRMFQIFGSPGVGKTEFAKLINMAVNYNCQTKDEEDFIGSIGYKKEKNVQAFFIRCENENTYQTAVKNIFELLLINENADINRTSAAHFIIDKIRKKKKTLFIFDDIKKYDEQDEFCNLWSEITGGLKKLNPNSECTFMLFYSGLLDVKESNNKSIKISSIKNFEKKYMIEYLNKRNISLNSKEYEKLFALTKGNIQILSKVADKYNNGESFEINYNKLNDITDLFYKYITEDEELLFKNILSLCISKNEIDINMLRTLTSSPTTLLINQFNKLQTVGLIRKNNNSSFSVTEALLVPAIDKEYLFITLNQNIIMDLVQQTKLIVGNEIVHELIQPMKTDAKLIQILDTLKKNSDSKNFTATLRISYLLKNVPKLKEQIEEIDRGSFYEKLIYFVADALIGYGAYKEATEEIKTNTNYYVLRPATVTSENFDVIFLLGNLFHLQNQYTKAIEHFKIMSESENVKESLYYKSKCYWGIAHCYRHIGNLDQAIDYYENSITICELDTVQTKAIYIKCMNELNNIFFYRNEKQPFSFDHIDALIEEKNSVADLSTNKYKAIEQGMKGNFDNAIKLIDETIKIYEKKSERLQFNLLFEKGELLRRKKDFKQSIEYFKKSLDNSLINGDKNIELYSNLGILSVEFECNTHYFTKSKEEQFKLLEHCLELCQNEEEDVCFELGKQHVVEMRDILNAKGPSFYSRILPLF
ncbi:tetratricopeptide repeat protein [Paenibacillus xylanexedens]|uniref:tetratricopeptide repeat protein n=1 Tax=Paenibacillus xylanexedens TaxID=528191 RepID=UPI003CFDB31B